MKLVKLKPNSRNENWRQNFTKKKVKLVHLIGTKIINKFE